MSSSASSTSLAYCSTRCGVSDARRGEPGVLDLTDAPADQLFLDRLLVELLHPARGLLRIERCDLVEDRVGVVVAGPETFEVQAGEPADLADLDGGLRRDDAVHGRGRSAGGRSWNASSSQEMSMSSGSRVRRLGTMAMSSNPYACRPDFAIPISTSTLVGSSSLAPASKPRVYRDGLRAPVLTDQTKRGKSVRRCDAVELLRRGPDGAGLHQRREVGVAPVEQPVALLRVSKGWAVVAQATVRAASIRPPGAVVGVPAAGSTTPPGRTRTPTDVEGCSPWSLTRLTT